MKKLADLKVGMMLDATFEVQFTDEASMELMSSAMFEALVHNLLFGPNIVKRTVAGLTVSVTLKVMNSDLSP